MTTLLHTIFLHGHCRCRTASGDQARGQTGELWVLRPMKVQGRVNLRHEVGLQRFWKTCLVFCAGHMEGPGSPNPGQ